MFQGDPLTALRRLIFQRASFAISPAFTCGHSSLMMLKQTESRMRPLGMIK
jgi:hypothetical protein